MNFFRFWLTNSIIDIAYLGTKEELKAELEEMFPGTFNGRIEEIHYSHFETIKSESRHEWN